MILATDLNGRIKAFYYQKISSPESAAFRDEKFLEKFKGLKLEDFVNEDISIADPSSKSYEDFKKTLRGIKKSLILHEEFNLKGASYPAKEGML